MRFADLQPEWVCTGGAADAHVRDAALTIENAQGVLFLCPKCFRANGGERGTHSVLAWFRDRGVADGLEPGPGRWIVNGTGFDDITLSPSIDLTRGPGMTTEWHGFVTNGEVTNV